MVWATAVTCGLIAVASAHRAASEEGGRAGPIAVAAVMGSVALLLASGRRRGRR